MAPTQRAGTGTSLGGISCLSQKYNRGIDIVPLILNVVLRRYGRFPVERGTVTEFPGLGAYMHTWVPIMFVSTGSPLFNGCEQLIPYLSHQEVNPGFDWVLGTCQAPACQTVVVDDAGPWPSDTGRAAGDRITGRRKFP